MARAEFEAAPPATHTRADYVRVIDDFRVIYHANPADPHAARAAAEVAELLTEQGRELSDPKALKDAAGQWQFLGKAYPAYAKTAAAKVAELQTEIAGSAAPDAAPQRDVPPSAIANDTPPEISSLPPMPLTDAVGTTEQGASNRSHKPTQPPPVAHTASSIPTPAPANIAGIATADHYRKPLHSAAASSPAKNGATPVAPPAPAIPVIPVPPPRMTSAGPHTPGAPVQPPPPTADGQTSLVRALGLKIGRIVIDAGHGGHDSGTLGAGGIEEKDVVLDVALRLGKLLHDRLGAEIIYTRSDDTFVPLEERTAIANRAQADLFISVHANSSQDNSARGVEVYYLNFTSDPEAMRVAARENAVSTQSVHDLSDLVAKIALKDKIDESKELASDVDASLYAGLTRGNTGLKNRGVKKAPFVVLIGANMPSILAEISFVTNPADASQLRRPEYRQRVAESLYGGVAKYAAGINGPAAHPKTAPTQRAAR